MFWEVIIWIYGIGLFAIVLLASDDWRTVYYDSEVQKRHRKESRFWWYIILGYIAIGLILGLLEYLFR